ncbi:MAG: hypothetical protein FK734_09980 [Asgard group archaeon]|nr:hypothetical protein [Asgard group archaeon]
MNESIKESKVKLKYVFYFEAIINMIVLVICIFLPEMFLEQLTNQTFGIVGKEMVRWYGILLFVITFILIGALFTEKKEFVIIVLLGYIIGDFAQIGVTIYLGFLISYWSYSLIITLALTGILILFRLIVLIKPQLLGLTERGIMKYIHQR